MSSQLRGIKESTLLAIKAKDGKEGKKIFPIFNAQGNFVGSVIYNPNGIPKYIKEFKGNFTCFGHHFLPKLFYGKPVVVVEGIFDALTLIQEGVPTIAIVGSEFNKTQLKEIYRYTNKLVFCPDSDSTGIEALQRMITKIDKMKGYNWTYKIINQSYAKDLNDLLQKDRNEFDLVLNEIKDSLL